MHAMHRDWLPLSAFVLVLLFVVKCTAWTARGCVDLDSSTFDKVVKKFRYTLVKFDTAFPYGDKHEAFTSLAQQTVGNDELLFALVGIKDYGEKDNTDLERRFGIPKEYPVVKLFSHTIDKPIDFPSNEEISADNLRLFLKRNTDLYIGLPGCVQKLDDFVHVFLHSSDSVEQQSIIDQIETLGKALDETDKFKTSYQTYAALMRKILHSKKPPSVVVQDEMDRIGKILQGKLSDTKRHDLKLRTNIMQSFLSESTPITSAHSSEL
ncbi:protein windbeutel-like isoform X1 [Anopheles albimanus]|uniref:protein windbeutel-like isoform X1 n=1 Tax=Anopheles albimanus TaxID=7167 RepID=UPI00163FC2AB|nr:protein windbeutel-like isoform X1 [Anopheles albimanus]